MRVFIYVYENAPCGIPDVYEQGVYEVKSLEEAENIGNEMADNVISEYFEDEAVEPDLECDVYKITEDCELSMEALADKAFCQYYKSFIADYCDGKLD